MKIVGKSFIGFVLILIFVVAISGCASNTWTSDPANPDAAQGKGGADIWTSGKDNSQGSWNVAQSIENAKSTDTSEQNTTHGDSGAEENIK